MHSSTKFHSLSGRSPSFWFVLGTLGLLVGAAGLAALYMDHNGHWVTGMTNQVVWGLPHTCAFFLILCASGALNVASIGSVMGKIDYRPLGRLSCLLAVALLAGGLAVLVLDLGRSDRLDVAATHFNFTSIFAFNIFLYTGFFGFCVMYLWAMMDPMLARLYKPIAVGAFIWRLILTTGSGSILGFLVSRTGYHSALIAPMFIAFSLSFGLAVFILSMSAVDIATGRLAIPDPLLKRMRNLLGILVAVSAYMVAVYHLTNLYSAERRGFERFILVEGGILTWFFWLGFVGIGSGLPLLILFTTKAREWLAVASLCVAVGGVAIVYVMLIGTQAFPIELFPGRIVSSSFFDGTISHYHPKLPEFLLGIGGFSLTALLLMVGLWVLPLLPGVELADKE
jgi:Ni/Fe-hydrogenase subunit HybB-like protein